MKTMFITMNFLFMTLLHISSVLCLRFTDLPDMSLKYPDYCCQLEWAPMNQGEKLPEHYVKSGTFLNRDWGYIVSNGNRGFKSDQSSEQSIILPAGEKIGKNYVLTNPNNCKVDWFPSTFYKQETPNNSSLYFPTLTKDESRFGDFARFNGAPAYIFPMPATTTYFLPWVGIYFAIKYYRDSRDQARHALDGIVRPITENDYETVKADKYDLLYVDCLNSIPDMSSAKLYNITYSTFDIDHLKSVRSPVEYTKKVQKNDSPVPTSSDIKFEIETTDSMSLKLSQSHSKFFKTTQDSYTEWHGGRKFEISVPGLATVAADGSVTHKSGVLSEEGGKTDNEREILSQKVKRKNFEFSQTITVPPYSKSVLVASSKPVKGVIPFTAIYELTPTGNNNVEVLAKTLERYGLNQMIEKTPRGTLLVHYDGSMSVDAGHEIDVDIQTTKLETAPTELYL